jgi:hypothetical protein
MHFFVMLIVPGCRAGNMHIGVIKVTCVYTDSYRFPDSLYTTQTLSLIKLFSNNHCIFPARQPGTISMTSLLLSSLLISANICHYVKEQNKCYLLFNESQIASQLSDFLIPCTQHKHSV